MIRLMGRFMILTLAAVMIAGVSVATEQVRTSRRPGSKSYAVAEAKPDPEKDPRSGPGPWNDPYDESVWPNATSHANSDEWLARNHDKIRKMRPRVLLVNFSNEHDRAHLDKLAADLIRALAESSRYHGYDDPAAPSFLDYRIFSFVDLRDADRKVGDSRLVPLKNPAATEGFNFRYTALFSQDFAARVGVTDPKYPKKFLDLKALLDRGYIHEVWFFTSGNEKQGPHIGAFEVVEQKPIYDARFRKVPGRWVQAGNGGDDDQPWAGRSVRIGNINASRGVGCFMESLAHGIEGMSNSQAIPWFTHYFREYAGFDLKSRYGVPFDSLYAVSYGNRAIEYPDARTMIVTHEGKPFRIENYVAAGGNAHFPPNGRSHYDLNNDQPVFSTIEDWRVGSGPEKQDVAKPFTNRAFERYRALAPDCMGAWLVYWRQNMPGLDNRQKDDQGKPMKNWWPFLFY